MALTFETKRFLGKAIRWSALIGFAVAAIRIAGVALAYAPPAYGWPAGFVISVIVVGLVVVLASVLFFIGCFAVLFPNYRFGAAMIIGSLIVGGLMFSAGPVAERIERQRWSAMTERAQPLIAAIDAYETKYQKPPESLDALVPEFLPEIPDTGFAVSPKFEYVPNGSPGPWRVWVNIPGGFFGPVLMFTRDKGYRDHRKPVAGEWFLGDIW